MAGPSVQFNVTVTNTGNVALSKVKLTDPAYSSSPIMIGTLAAGTSYKITYTLPWSSGNHTYPVSVIGVYHGKQYTASDNTYYLGDEYNPSIKVVKTANLALAQIGETVTYTFTVTNPGNVPLSSVTVSDSVSGTATLQSGDANSNTILETTETWIFTDTWTVAASPDPLENTATATGYYGTTPYTDTDSDSLDVTEHGPTPITLASSNPQQGGQYGEGVAIGGGYIAVGAYNEDIDIDIGPWAAGRVYVYDATTKDLVATLISPHPETNGEFGFIVAISEGYLLVGAPYEDGNGAFDSDQGAAYVYVLTDLNAAPLELTSTNPTDGGEFGYALATDGVNVFVGAESEAVNGLDDAGVVHIFSLSGGSYVDDLTQPVPEANAHYGFKVVVNDARLYVSAPDAEDASTNEVGAVYVYDLDTRNLLATLNSPMPRQYGNFGISLTASGDYIIVGAEAEDDWATSVKTGIWYPLQGLVHVFDATTYENISLIQSPYKMSYGYFGREVATDGTYLVVSAPGEGTPAGSGKAYVYSLSDVTATPVILTSPNPEYSAEFGTYSSIGISDGTVIIGASDESDSGYSNVGHAYIFSLA